MIITWASSNQHTEWGLFKVGDVIDTTEKKIPDPVVESWTRDGFAVPEPAPVEPKPEKPKKVKKPIEEA
jgi:hypothetical protein